MGKYIEWGIVDLERVAKDRQKNKLDVIIAWTGNRGNGKSTGAFKLSSRFKGFKPWDNIIYARNDAMKLLEGNKFGTIMDDEAIRSAYKRNFQDTDQKLLVQMLNMYRDNFNLYNLCIPKFYSLDRDLRDLIKIHIHVIERGLAVVHIAREDVLYSDDPWDVKYNQKVEDSWGEKKKKNANFKPPYNKLTTFAGYLRFGPLGKKQQLLYDEIKATKRKTVYDTEMTKEGNIVTMKDGYTKIYELMMYRHSINNPLRTDQIQVVCQAMGLNVSNAMSRISEILKNKGYDKTAKDYVNCQKVSSNSKNLLAKAKDLSIEETTISHVDLKSKGVPIIPVAYNDN